MAPGEHSDIHERRGAPEMANQWVGIKQVFLSSKKYSELLKTKVIILYSTVYNIYRCHIYDNNYTKNGGDSRKTYTVMRYLYFMQSITIVPLNWKFKMVHFNP